MLLKDFLALFKTNTAHLPGADTFDTASKHRLGIDGLNALAGKIDEVNAQAESSLAEAVRVAKEAAFTEGKTAAMAEIATTHVPKVAHDAAVQSAAESAKLAGREEAERDFNAKIAAGAERTKLAAATGLPAEVLAKVPDALLTPATAEATILKLTTRTAALTALGKNAKDHPVMFAATAEGLDEAGDAQFASTIALIKEAAAVGTKVGATAEKKPGHNPLMEKAKEGEPVRMIM